MIHTRVFPSRHDHTRHMVFTATTSRCTACGAAWELTDRGWVPVNAGSDR